MNSQIVGLVKELRDIKIKLEPLEEEVKQLKKREAFIEKGLLPELFFDDGVESVKIEGAGTAFMQSDAYVNVTEDNKDAFFDYLMQEGESDIIKSVVHPGTLKAWAKEKVKAGHLLPDVVDYKPYSKIVLRK